MRALFIGKPPGIQPETNLLRCCRMHCHRRNDFLLGFVWNHHELFVVFADGDVPPSLGVKVTLAGMTNDMFELLQIESPDSGSMFEILSPLYHKPSCGYSSYFNRAPFGTSSANVAMTGFPSSPTEAANNMPCDSYPRSLRGFSFATTTILRPTNFSGS